MLDDIKGRIKNGMHEITGGVTAASATLGVSATGGGATCVGGACGAGCGLACVVVGVGTFASLGVVAWHKKRRTKQQAESG